MAVAPPLMAPASLWTTTARLTTKPLAGGRAKGAAAFDAELAAAEEEGVMKLAADDADEGAHAALLVRCPAAAKEAATRAAAAATLPP